MIALTAPRNPLNQLIWLGIAIAGGILIATQPITTIVGGMALVILTYLATYTPLTVLTVALILSPMGVLLTTEASFQLPLDIGQLLTMAFIGAWIVFRIIHHRPLRDIRWSSVHISLLLFIIATGLTVFTAESLNTWLNEWLKWVLMLTVALLVYNLAYHRQWQWIVFGLIIAGVANAIIGIHIFFGGSGALHLLINNRFFRAFGTFGQPNPFGGFMGLLLPIATMMSLGYLLTLWHTWRKSKTLPLNEVMWLAFYGMSAGLLGIGVIISWSRGAWLSMGVSFVVMAIAIPRRWWQSLFLAGCIVILGSIIWSSNRLPATIQDRIQSSTEELFAVNDARAVDVTIENFAVLERLAHWQAATNIARYNPWLGVGFGNYEIVYEDYRLINWDEPLGHAHNYYLNVLAEAGIIGAFCYGVMWILILGFTWRIRKHPDNLSRAVSIGIIGTWVYLATHSLTDNLYVNNLFLHLGVIIGLVAILHRPISQMRTIGKLWHSPK